MKKAAILLIDIYKQFLSVVIKNIAGAPNVCRFQEHCDDYARRMITEEGLIKGSYLATLRLLKCQPFYKGSLI